MNFEEMGYKELKAYAKANNIDASGKTEVLRARLMETVKIEQTVLSDEDKIFGKKSETVVKKVFNYEDENRLYKVFNLKLNNGYTIVTGDVVETFIGHKNLEARKELKEGAKKVTTYNADGKEQYRIEVL